MSAGLFVSGPQEIWYKNKMQDGWISLILFLFLTINPDYMIAKMPLENFLVIDIETVSAQKNYNLLAEDWQHLWEEKVKRTVPDDSFLISHAQ